MTSKHFRTAGDVEEYPHEGGDRYEDFTSERPDSSPREASPSYEDYSGDEATSGYEDTRRAVSGMLEEMKKKKSEGKCKEVKKDGMTCLQCSDDKGVQVISV